MIQERPLHKTGMVETQDTLLNQYSRITNQRHPLLIH